MKKFIKNTVVSLLHSKYVLCLLFLFSLLSAALFASYTNADKSHMQKYDTVMSQGVKPDIAVYQNYDYSFQIVAEKPQVSKLSSLKAKINKLAKFVNFSLVDDKQSYVFKFSSVSNYAKYATEANPSGYKIDPTNPVSECFRAYDPNFFWVSTMSEDQVNSYIAEKSNLFLTELQNDPTSKVSGYINKYSQENFHAPIQEQQFKSLTVDTPTHIYEIAQVNANDQTNKIVYKAGAGNLVKEITPFDQFSTWFNIIRNNLNDTQKTTDEIFPSAYIEFYRALWANISDQGTDLKSALNDLISHYAPSGTAIPITSGDRNTLDQYFKKFEMINSADAISFNWLDAGFSPNSIVITNPSAFQTVISTANVYHGNYRYSLEAYQEWDKFLNENNDGKKYNRGAISKELTNLSKNYPNSLTYVENENNKLLIVGEGITPNYIYPIAVSGKSFSIDINKICLLYLTPSGFQMMQESFTSAPLNDISFVKFPDSASREQIQNAINEINNWSDEHMTLLKNDAAYFIEDQSGLNAVTGIRIAFLPDFSKRINNIFLYVCIMVWVLIILVSFFIIKTIIDKNQNIISIFNANGFRMSKMIFSFVLLVTLPLIVGNFFGFVLGIFTQKIIDIFSSSYWVTVQPGLMVDWQSFIILFIFFAAIFIIGSFLMGMLMVRKTLIAALKNTDNYKNSRIAMVLKKPFFFTSVITRFRISIIFNAFQKMLILIVLITITTSVFSFFLSTFGRFDQVRFYAKEENNYSYAIQLQTPTRQSGPLQYVDYYELGKTSNGFENNGNKLLSDWKNLQFSSTSTLDQFQSNILFLKDSVSSKLTLNYYFGSDKIVGANAWTLAAGMMPTNQLVAANKSYEQILEYLHGDVTKNYLIDHKIKLTRPDDYSDYFIKKDINNNYSINTDNALAYILNIPIGLSQDFANFLQEEFFAKQKELAASEKTPPVYNYSVAYTSVGLNQQTIGGNKFYDGKVYTPPKYGFLKMDSVDGLNFYGIQNNDPNDADYLGPKLVLPDGTVVNNQLAKPTVITDPQHPVYNVIINNALATFLNLSVGSTFSRSFINFADRIFAKNKKDDLDGKLIPGVMKHFDDEITFKVIGISRGANSQKAYINFEDANKILDFLPKSTDNPQKPYYFNGFFASESDKLDFFNHAISLFSLSGLYPGVEKFSSSSFKGILENTIDKGSSTPQYQQLLLALGLTPNDSLDKSKADDYITTLKNKYNIPYTPMLYNLYSAEADMQMFSSTAKSINTILIFVISVIVFMTFFILIMVSFLIVNNLKNIGTRMQVLGYYNREVLESFLAIYVPSFFVGILLSQPLLAIIIKVFCDYIFHLTGIALTVQSSLIIATLGSLAVFGMLLISFVICYYIYSKTNLPEAIKGF